MASPRYYFPESMEVGAVECFIQWVSLAAGAVPTTNGTGAVVYADAIWAQSHVPAGIVYTGAAGTGYTLNLEESWIDLLEVGISVQQATYSATGAVSGNVEATNFGAAGQATLTIIFRTAAGAAAALAVGDTVRCDFIFKNSQV